MAISDAERRRRIAERCWEMVDYRNRPLENFPHHLHDSEDRIHSFEGQLKHFIERATQLLNQ